MQMEELMEKYANLRRAYCCQSFLIKKKKKKKASQRSCGPRYTRPFDLSNVQFGTSTCHCLPTAGDPTAQTPGLAVPGTVR